MLHQLFFLKTKIPYLLLSLYFRRRYVFIWLDMDSSCLPFLFCFYPSVNRILLKTFSLPKHFVTCHVLKSAELCKTGVLYGTTPVETYCSSIGWSVLVSCPILRTEKLLCCCDSTIFTKIYQLRFMKDKQFKSENVWMISMYACNS